MLDCSLTKLFVANSLPVRVFRAFRGFISPGIFLHKFRQ